MPVTAAKVVTKATLHPAAAVRRAPAQNTCVRAPLHRVLPHPTRAEGAPTAPSTETAAQALQAVPTTEATPRLREALLQAPAAVQVAVWGAEAVDQAQAPQATAQVPAVTALAVAEAVVAVAAEEDNFLPTSTI